MGLDINSQSEKTYHAGYTGIHQIRFMAYKAQDGKKSFSDWMAISRHELDPDWPYALCLLFYPNLYWHSDCDGTYTLRGKVDFTKGTLQTGNSKQLLWELEDIKEMLSDSGNLESIKKAEERTREINDLDWSRFNMLYELVKDVVENHDGRIEFL